MAISGALVLARPSLRGWRAFALVGGVGGALLAIIVAGWVIGVIAPYFADVHLHDLFGHFGDAALRRWPASSAAGSCSGSCAG